MDIVSTVTVKWEFGNWEKCSETFQKQNLYFKFTKVYLILLVVFRKQLQQYLYKQTLNFNLENKHTDIILWSKNAFGIFVFYN